MVAMAFNHIQPVLPGISKTAYRNLPVAKLVEMAVQRDEGVLTATGALRVATGKYTGRSPDDKFLVDRESIHDRIWWQNNKKVIPEQFEALYQRLKVYLQDKELFIFDGFAGADPSYRLPIRVINELAWQNLFAHQLFRRPVAAELADHNPEFTIIAVPGFQSQPSVDGTNSEAVIMLDFEQRLVVIGGTSYAGEIKKAVFTVMNYLLPLRGVLPMHCSANVGRAGDVALFFGLSGTEKPPCQPIQSAFSSVMTNMVGLTTASLILKAAAMPKPLGFLGSMNPRSGMPFALVPCWKTWY
jgi:phosphoenolpyruvate carboxykinase (ATP)